MLSSYAILRMITDDEPRLIREINPDIPEWLCLLISRLMAKSPDARFGNALEVADLLEQCLAHVQQPTSVPLPASLVSHATDRNGTMSLRLVDKEIRGGWTTDEGAQLESGTPLLGDLLWKRSVVTVPDGGSVLLGGPKTARGAAKPFESGTPLLGDLLWKRSVVNLP